jgi:hypothetical protein
MENSTLLKELLKIKLIDSNGIFAGVNAAGFESLLNRVQVLAAADENKNITSKTRLSFINKAFNKNKELDKKPILKCYSEQLATYKTITNGFSLYALKDDDFKPLENIIFHADEEKYPHIEKIADFNFKDLCYKLELKVDDLLTMIKLKGITSYKYNYIAYDALKFEYFNIVDKKIDYVGLSATELLLFINMLNFKKDDTIIFYFGNKCKPLHAKNKNGSYGLILPIRLD